MGITLVGLPAVRKALQRSREIAEGDALMQEIAGEVDDAGLHIMSVAQQKAPVKWGTLRGSGQAHKPEITYDSIEVELTFGGLASQYADVQHERKDYRHPKGGQDHFLFGEPYSAWEQERSSTMDELDRAVGEKSERYIQE